MLAQICVTYCNSIVRPAKQNSNSEDDKFSTGRLRTFELHQAAWAHCVTQASFEVMHFCSIFSLHIFCSVASSETTLKGPTSSDSHIKGMVMHEFIGLCMCTHCVCMYVRSVHYLFSLEPFHLLCTEGSSINLNKMLANRLALPNIHNSCYYCWNLFENSFFGPSSILFWIRFRRIGVQVQVGTNGWHHKKIEWNTNACNSLMWGYGLKLRKNQSLSFQDKHSDLISQTYGWCREQKNMNRFRLLGNIFYTGSAACMPHWDWFVHSAPRGHKRISTRYIMLLAWKKHGWEHPT
jgi:hypothetical protein